MQVSRSPAKAALNFAAPPSTLPIDTIDIARLNPEQRLQLLQQIWDSLAATPDAVPITSAQREELSRRLDDLDREGPIGIPWDEVLRKVHGQS